MMERPVNLSDRRFNRHSGSATQNLCFIIFRIITIIWNIKMSDEISRVVKNLKKNALALGFDLIAQPPAPGYIS